MSKPGATLTEADAALGSYVSLRNAAEQELDAAALADIEQGTMLDIDQSAFAIRGVLGIDGRPWTSETPRPCGRRASTSTRCGSSRS